MSRHLIFGLADDLTGALETGAKFAARGLSAEVVTDAADVGRSNCPVVVLDTETRHMTADEAGECVRRAGLQARELRLDLLYKKTDSTLRGNIAAEFRALRSVFGNQELMYVPAYPDLGRTVRGGELMVWGRPVHETEFAKDRRSPISRSSIQELLGDAGVLIVNGETNEDIEAAAVRLLEGAIPRLCGGPAALAGALARELSCGSGGTAMPRAERALVVNGSLHPASVRQVERARQEGLFGDGWVLLEEAVKGVDSERALQVGECVRRVLSSAQFDAVVVFGGDTAFGIHRVLGARPFKAVGEVVPGVAVSRSGGLTWVTKAGGFGEPDVLFTIRDGLR